jgi:hypothetical protein
VLFKGLVSKAEAVVPAGLSAAAGSDWTPNLPAAMDEESDNRPTELIVIFSGAAKPLSSDDHLSLVDLKRSNAVSLYAQAQRNMISEIEAAGLEAADMASYNATPVATYARINAATIKVEAGQAQQFRKMLEGKGFKVFDNARREIVRPVIVDPETMDPSARGAVSLDENLKLTKADLVQEMARKVWGAPGMGRLSAALRRFMGVAVPQPAVAVIDTGVDLKHPLLKRVKGMVNATSGPNVDDNGHGSWVTSMVLNYAPWLKSVTHYKTFVDGGASIDDILKALTLSGNDGNLIISNSWGSDDGDPESPDSLMVKKLAEEGHVMVFAAGNAGPLPNTIGAPAIVHYKDAKTEIGRAHV